MFGERYFAARERLSGLMDGIAALAAESSAALGEDFLSGRQGRIAAPFVFVACGEVNAGKSMFLNGLLGLNLCRTNVLPETEKIGHYRHGVRASVSPKDELEEERRHPHGILRDFEVIDTPGINSRITGHLPLIAKVLPAADLIFIVFPISNPWSPATWDLIQRVPEELRDRLLIIIQQADQKEPEDAQVILGHVRDLAVKRLGVALPAFAVSGKAALSGEGRAASGYAALDDFISRNVCGSAGRMEALQRCRAAAAAGLRQVEDSIEGQARGLREQDRFLDQVEGEIDGMREQFVSRLPHHLAGVAEVFQTEAAGVSQVLKKRLGALRSIYRLFTGDRTAQEIEALFLGRLQAAVQSVAELDGAEVEEACLRHWGGLTVRVREAVGVDLTTSDAVRQRLAGAREGFVERLGGDARKGIGNLKVRNQLDRVLNHRNTALKSFTFMTLALLTAAGVCGALAVPWVPVALCAGAAVFFSGGLMTAVITRRRMTGEFRDHLLDTCGSFASLLRSDYDEALRVVFQEYRDSLDDIRTHIVAARATIEPRQKRWSGLFLTLKAIEQDL